MWSLNQDLTVVQRKIVHQFGVFDVLSVRGLVFKFCRPKSKDEWKIDEEINRKIIRHYTRESGVRGLNRVIEKISVF